MSQDEIMVNAGEPAASSRDIVPFIPYLVFVLVACGVVRAARTGRDSAVTVIA